MTGGGNRRRWWAGLVALAGTAASGWFYTQGHEPALYVGGACLVIGGLCLLSGLWPRRGGPSRAESPPPAES